MSNWKVERRITSMPQFDLPFLGSDLLGEGFDSLFSGKKASFPPYDVLSDGDSVIVRMALAGYSKENINVEITKQGTELVVSGTPTETLGGGTPKNVLHAGIANRAFSQRFKLAPGLKIGEVTMKDGILTIPFVKTKSELDGKVTII